MFVYSICTYIFFLHIREHMLVLFLFHYLHQGGYVFASVCLSVSWITEKVVDEFLRHLTRKKPFDFGADPDHDPDPEILNGFFHCGIKATVRILPRRDRRCCENFAGSPALTEVFGFRVFLVLKFFYILKVVTVKRRLKSDVNIKTGGYWSATSSTKLSCTIHFRWIILSSK